MGGEEDAGVVHEIDGCCCGFVVAGFGVRQAGVAVDRGMQVGVTDAGLLVLRFPALGSFGLVGAAAVGTPPAAVRDLPDFLDVDVDHLTRSLGGDDLGFSVGFAVRVDEPATVQSQAPQDSRDRPTSNDDAVGAQFERDS